MNPADGVAANDPLLAAIEHARRGLYATARRELARAPDTDLPTHLVARALVSYVLRDYGPALELLDRAARTPGGAMARRLSFERASRLGWSHRAMGALESMLRESPSPRLHAEAAALYARRRVFDRALEHGRAALAAQPANAPLLIELANVHAQRDELEPVRVLTAQAIALEPNSLPYRLEAARLLTSVGLLDEARAELRAALEIEPECADAHERLGALAAWSGDDGDAERHAEAALAIEPAHGGAHRLLGVVAHLRGRSAEAERRLADALRDDPNESEAHVWLAEIAFSCGDTERAHAELSRAVAVARGYLFSAQLLRFFIALPVGDEGTKLGGRSEHLLAGVRQICPELADELESGSREQWSRASRRALERMRGNRSTTPTFLPDEPHARPILVRAGSEPRFDARRALETIRIVPPAEALAAIAAVVETYPWSSLPLAHQGELQLWLGDLPGARASLQGSIEKVRGTRWAYVGLAIAELLEGNLEASLETNARGVTVMQGTEGPAVFGVRGEALRRLGRLDEAEIDLQRSAVLNPTRLGTALNLALLRVEQGRVDQAGALLRELVHQAPGLLADAAREVSVELWGDSGVELPPDAVHTLLRHALSMLRGNRSSTCHTYFTREGELRLVPHRARGARGPHQDDADDLGRARALLRRATLNAR